MRRPVALALASVAAIGVLIGSGSRPSLAKDFGQAGHLFPIIEPDLLAVIESRLKRLEASGEIVRTNAAFARRATQRIRRPAPVAGITPATANRSWTFDPTVVIENDIRDHKGNLIAVRGQAVNPLDFVSVRQALVFVDGDSVAEMDWAAKRFAALDAKIILVDGSPIEAMTARKRRFYFDQDGRLTSKFGIRHTPAVVTQAGKLMHVSEQLLAPAKTG